MAEWSRAEAPPGRPQAEAGPWERSMREELAARIARAVRTDGAIEPLKGVVFSRASSPNEPLHSVYKPVFCVIAQGSKEIFLGTERYLYNPAHYLLVTADLPLAGHVLEASEAQPYLGLRVDLDPRLVGSVMAEAGQAGPRSRTATRAIDVSPLDATLLDAVVRLVRLVDTPDAAHVLQPLILREIVYRLLMGRQGDRLRYVAVQSGPAHHIVRAIEQLHGAFDQPLRVDAMASALGMSVSGFHHHFKAVTGISPLQFQKRLRLQEARRLMLGERLDVAGAARRVGYDDASHFNREYKRLFGASPLRDVERLRESAGARAA